MKDKSQGIVSIYTAEGVNEVHSAQSLVVEINGERIPYIHRIEFAHFEAGRGDLVTATIELAVRLGKP